MSERPGGRSRFADALTAGAYRAGAAAAKVVPGFVANGLVYPIGAAANAASPERRAMIQRHLTRIVPSLRGVGLRRAVQDAFDSYARYYVESFRLPSLPATTVERGIHVDGYEHLTAGLERGNGVILALPHLGGWEWAGRWATDRGHPMTVVVERIDPPQVFDWFVKLRARLGMTVVPLGPQAGRAVLQALRKNEVVCLLSDRNIGGGGIRVEFFGEHTLLPAGAATLSLRTSAPLLPTAVYFTPGRDGHHGVVRPPVSVERTRKLGDDVAAMTQAMAHEFERLIRRAPSQWHLFQPNWPSDPGYAQTGDRRRAADA
ncbi:phosphatidylinositol mannoside acyltransferase [soil metagenome]